MYPQGMIDKTQYATPTQRPVSSELMMDAPAYERSSPMLMAEGGIARYRSKGQVNVLQDYLDRQEKEEAQKIFDLCQPETQQHIYFDLYVVVCCCI
jgi:hypothetical protein